MTAVITFEPTAETGGEPRPDRFIGLTVKAFDINLGDYDPATDPVEIDILANEDESKEEAVLIAPDVTGERFIKWDFKEYRGEAIPVLRENAGADDSVVLKAYTVNRSMPKREAE